MSEIKLNESNFLEQVTKYGFFAEQFPSCFTSESLSAHLSELKPLIGISLSQRKHAKKNTTVPTTLSVYKNDISRRVLSVPNPEAFLRLAIYLEANWSKVIACTKSKNSLSPIFCMQNYVGGQQLINCESLREALKIKSDFLEGIKQSIRISLGYQYRLKVDIANCYSSMYTHSIAWAVCGKKDAKSYFRTNEPSSIKADYEFADCIDCFTRFEKNDETNGIVVGPFTSRIVSEIILTRIDKELNKKKLKFKRYVDDYKFYFRSESQALESIHIIEKVLNEYNLALNTSKTEIKRFPYEVVTNMQERYEKAYTKDGVKGILNEASLLYLAGEKGAYKYALKYMRNKPISDRKDLAEVIPTLVNITLLDPKYGKYISEYLCSNKNEVFLYTLERIFNEELEYSLESDLQQESLLFLQLLRDLELNIYGTNILHIIKSDNDFAIIIALDIWKNRKNKVMRNKTVAAQINKAISELMNMLRGENLKGSRWLLLYEIIENQLVDSTMIPVIRQEDMTDFFKKMFALNISFYQSVKKTH